MTAGNRSLSEILQDSLGNLQDIVRSEVRLARTEVGEELVKAKSASVWLGAGFVAGLFAILFLLLTGLQVLAFYVPMWAASLILSMGLGLIALVTLASGKKQFKTIQPVLPRTVETFKENVQWVKQRTK